MEVIDLHCDVLMKLYEAKGQLRFRDAPELDVNYQTLKKGRVKVQAFAVFVNPAMKSDEKFQAALDQIHYFYVDILRNHPEIKLIKRWQQLDELQKGEIGAILTLEGVDAIGNDLQKLSILYELGVRSVGLTWNNANLAADGVGEKRGAGITEFGREIIHFNNKHTVLTDVSHLSEKAFWDVLKEAQYPIASHSNAKTICNHPRNLTDSQTKALFKKNGMVHVVYYPEFVTNKRKATMGHLIKHIDHFCSLGGVKQVGLGSDFDGIPTKIKGLENAAMHYNLLNELLKFYKEDEVKGFAYENFLSHRPI